MENVNVKRDFIVSLSLTVIMIKKSTDSQKNVNHVTKLAKLAKIPLLVRNVKKKIRWRKTKMASVSVN